MYQFLILIHVLAAVFIIALVLVQQGKGATMGAAFGSGASQTVFGARGSGSFLFRITLVFVTVFFVTSLGLNAIATKAYKQERAVTVPTLLRKALPSPVQTQPSKQQTTAPSDQIPARK